MRASLAFYPCQFNLIRYKAIIIAQKRGANGIQEPELDKGIAIVIDIGKTHAKVSLWSREGRCLEKVTRANSHLDSAPYSPLDLAGTADWLIGALKAFPGHPVEAIIPVTHGAAVVGIRDGVLAFPPMDYEWEIPADVLTDYRKGRDPFAVTGSPALPCGLNFGVQLHYLETMDSLEGVTLMPYAQYWAWLLSGEARSEVTSLGCHSDLWAPAEGDFSPMAKRRGWAEKFAPLAKAGDAIGTLRTDLAELTGLPATIRIHTGLHDSNAALLAARAFPAIRGKEATVLSTGTWFIAMRCPVEQVDLSTLPGEQDCLVNVDAFDQPVSSARYMGGREMELLGERIDVPGTQGMADVLAQESMILPSHARGSGPFPDAIGCWINRPEAGDERCAAAALYAALMTDASLDLIGASGILLIEGRFAASELFTRALATLRPHTTVFTAGSEADVSFGALTLLYPDLAPATALARVEPLDRSLNDYRDEWRDDMEAFA